MRINEIREKLKTSFIGKPLIYYPEVSSTNEVAKELAINGSSEGTVVLTETQIQGKGRMGRKWFSPKGGLWFSMVLRPEMTPMRLSQLTLATATATVKTIKSLYGLKAEMKWPNDVLVNERKVCGILTETCTMDRKVKFAVVGVGVNANIDAKEFPPPLRNAATSLQAELGKKVNLEELLCNLLLQIENSYLRLLKEGFNPILEELQSLAMFLGRRVRILSFDERFVGIAKEVDETGALIVQLQNGTKKRVVVGDLQLLKLEC